MGKIWLIRHGITKYNSTSKDYNDQGLSLDEAPFRWDLDFCDAPLSEEGISQALPVQSQTAELDVSKIFVSPLRRALQTTDILFKDHPNSPQITVFPLLSEILHNSHDVSMFEGIPFEEYSHFDWSMVPADGTHLARHLLENGHTQQLEGLDYKQAQLKLLEIMRSLNPSYVEDENTECMRRAQNAINFAREQSQEGNIALVGHSTFFKMMTTRYDEAGNVIESVFLKNCEILEYNPN